MSDFRSKRPFITISAILSEALRAREIFVGWDYIVDILVYRLIGIMPVVSKISPNRKLTIRGGGSIAYRRNRGDIQGIREVFLDEAYRLPPNILPRVVVDLGANIGLTTIWLSRMYDIEKFVAVEPVPENARLLKKNLADNHVECEVIESAIASYTGTASFVAPIESNLGHMGNGGSLIVNTLTMNDIIEKMQCRINLLKLDIEGGEQELLSQSDLGWLSKIDAIIAEFHPKAVEYNRLTQILVDHGFTYHPPSTLWPDSMDIFVASV